MGRDFLSSQTFERSGVLVRQGEADPFGRPDAIEFQSRSGQRLIDWVGDVVLSVDRWPTRTGVAVILERAGFEWVPVAAALPFDAIYVRQEQEIKLVFGVYVRLEPGTSYRLHLPAAVLTKGTVRIGAIQRDPAFGADQTRTRPRTAPAAARRSA